MNQLYTDQSCSFLKLEIQNGQYRIRIGTMLRNITKIEFDIRGTANTKSEAFKDAKKRLGYRFNGVGTWKTAEYRNFCLNFR